MPGRDADRHRPLAQFRSRSTDSAAVTATGTTCWAASVREMSSRAARRQHDLISAPVQSASFGFAWLRILNAAVYISQMRAFSAVDGRSRNHTPSNLSLLLNSGGSLLMSLHVPMKNTSVWWSLNHVNKLPKRRADTPLSVCPLDDTPAKPFSTSSAKSTQGAIASTILNACRMFAVG